MSISNTIKKLSRRKIRFLVRDIEDSDLVLVEGNRRALLALSDLIIAVAKSGADHIQMSPTSAGNIYFKKGSTRGFYFNCIETIHKRHKQKRRS